MEFAQACMCDRTPFLKGPGIACNSTKSAKIVPCLLFVLEFYYKVITFKSFISLFTVSYIFYSLFSPPIFFSASLLHKFSLPVGRPSGECKVSTLAVF